MRCMSCHGDFPRLAFSVGPRHSSQRCAICRGNSARLAEQQTVSSRTGWHLREEHFAGSNIELIERPTIARDVAFVIGQLGFRRTLERNTS